MTQYEPARTGLSPDDLTAAQAALDRVRETIEAASRSEARPADVKQELEGYLHDHGPALQQAAAALSEEVRQQTLAELYKWRDQLDAQLRANQEGNPQDRPRG